MISTVKHQVKGQAGFTLMELVIAMVIASILAAIAYPSYINSITKTKRRVAEACLSNFATHMERFYTTNLRYDKDSTGADIVLPSLDCASAQNSGKDYNFRLSAKARSTFTLQAVPKSPQSIRDAGCGTLTLDQTGTRGVSGSAAVSQCW